MRLLFGLTLLALLNTTASAQRRCVKGIPCGGTCISATKTCHVGIIPPQRTEPAPTVRTLHSEQAVGPVSVDAGRAAAPFVGSATGHTYYPVEGCDAAASIPDSLRVYFASETAARLLRYERVTRCFYRTRSERKG
jgi:hypothetical protein